MLHFGAERCIASSSASMRSKTSAPSAHSPRFAACQPSSICANFVLVKREHFVPHFEEPEGFPDYLAGRAVAAGLHLALHELFKFGSERDVHAVPGSVLSLRVPFPFQPCQCWTSAKSDPPTP